MNNLEKFFSDKPQNWKWEHDKKTNFVMEDGGVVALLPSDGNVERQTSYACLIAATPELLEVVFELLQHRKEDKDGNHVCWVGEGLFMRAEEAFCKAIGEPQDFGPPVPFDQL